jgi:hypothetical protein
VALALALGSTACRSLAVCDDATCGERSTTVGGESPAPSAAGMAAGGSGFDEPSVAGGQGGTPIGGAESGGGMSGESAGGADCPGFFGECDGSSITECETPLDYHVRHCGACAAPCDGTCVVGHCKPAELIYQGGEPSTFVATPSHGYGVIAEIDGSGQALYKLDMLSGAVTPLMELSDFYFISLALGRDTLYLQADSDVYSMDLAGERIELEDLPSIWSFGANSEGVYSTTRVADELTDQLTDTLSFRPAFSSQSQVLREGGVFEIVGSGEAGIVLLNGNEDEERLLELVQADEIERLGPMPAGTTNLCVTAEGVAVLAVDDGELWWFRPGSEPTHYPVGVPAHGYWSQPVLTERGVAIQIAEGALSFVQEFASDGSLGLRLGISRNANLFHLSPSHAWYSKVLTPIELVLVRSRQFEVSDL